MSHILISVRDTGIGMDESTQAQLFRRFYQGETSAMRKAGGAGLGLAISAELVSLMGGTIGVYSQGPGLGSEFWFTLPVSYRAESSPPLSEEVSSQISFEGAQHVATRVAYQPASTFIRAKKIPPLLPEIENLSKGAFKGGEVAVVTHNSRVIDLVIFYLRRWGMSAKQFTSYEDLERSLMDEDTEGSQKLTHVIGIIRSHPDLPKTLVRPGTHHVMSCGGAVCNLFRRLRFIV